MNRQDLLKISNVNIIPNTDYTLGGTQFNHFHEIRGAVDFIDTFFVIINKYLLRNSTRKLLNNQSVMIFFLYMPPAIYLAHP